MSTIWDDEPAAMSTTCAVEHSNCPADCRSMTLLLKLVNLSADKYLHKCFVRSLPSSSCFAGSCIQHTCCRQQKASPYDLVLSNSLLASIIPAGSSDNLNDMWHSKQHLPAHQHGLLSRREQ